MLLSDVELAVDSLDDPDPASPPHVYLNCVLSSCMHPLYDINSDLKNNNGLPSVKTLTTSLPRDVSMTRRGIYACTTWRRQRHRPTYLEGTDLSVDPWIRWERLSKERQVMCAIVPPYNHSSKNSVVNIGRSYLPLVLFRSTCWSFLGCMESLSPGVLLPKEQVKLSLSEEHRLGVLGCWKVPALACLNLSPRKRVTWNRPLIYFKVLQSKLGT